VLLLYKTCKSIKKAAKITAYITLSLLLVLALALFFLQTPYVSNKILEAAKKAFTEQTKSKVEIGSVRIDFFNRISIKNLYVEDIHGDTLLFAKTINVRFAPSQLLHNQIVIKNARLNGINFRLAIDSTKMLNLSYIIRAFTSQEVDTTKKSKWKFSLQNAEVVGSKFRLHRYNANVVKRGFNAQDISVVYLNVKISKFRLQHDSVMFNINKLMAVEQSGVYIKKFRSQFSICSRHLNFDDIHFETSNSKVDAPRIHMKFKSFTTLSDDFIHNVKFDGEIEPSQINISDIAFFAPTLWGLKSTIAVTGKVTGPIAELRGKNITASFGSQSIIEGNFDLTGLPNIYETFIFADFKQLHTNVNEVQTLISGFKNKNIELPAIISKFGNISYKGKYTGFINDFVAYGKLNTALGNLVADISIKPGTDKNIKFQGKLSTDGFQVGQLAGTKILGQAVFSAKTNGYIEKGQVTANLDAVINKLQLNNYNYSNINVLGKLDKKNFTGQVNVNDTNLYLRFDGTANFQNSTPDFYFFADINANMFPLGLSKDTSLTIKSSIDANFSGKQFDDITGAISLTNSELTNNKHHVKIKRIRASSYSDNNGRNISLESEIAQALITGQFTLPQLLKEGNKWISRYTPSLDGNNTALLPSSKEKIKKKKIKTLDTDNQAQKPLGEINIDMNLLNADELISFFVPSMKIGKKTELKGHYSGITGKLDFNASTTHLILGNNLLQQITIHGNADLENFKLNTFSKYLFSGEDTLLRSISITNNLRHDTIQWGILWKQNSDSSQISSVKAESIFKKTTEVGTQMCLNIKPGRFFANDSIWQIEPSKITIDTSAIRFFDVSFSHANQYLKANGVISKRTSDTLYCDINNFRINTLDLFTKNSAMKFDGELYGKASLTELFSKPTIQCNAKVENFKFNNELLGTAYILTSWNQDERELHLNTYIQKGSLKTINLVGIYYPESKALSFTSHLEKARVTMLQPFVKGIFSNLSGIITGDATIEGYLNKPDINGNFRLQKMAFKVDYLNTTYNFNSDLIIDNNTFILPNSLIYDSNGNICNAKLTIDHQNFKNLTLDAHLIPNNLLCLNTTEDDNELFYGSAYATGNIYIHGPLNRLTLDINATTNKNTRIFIPLNKQSEVRENKFVTFVKPISRDSVLENPLAKKKNEYRVNTNGLMLNFKLDVTPDAELQLIFDKRVGDIIKGRGYGNIDMEINTLGKFLMYGDFRITQGEYLFTLQNIINKRFTVEENGHIQWNGSPVNADIDLTAVYSLKASLAGYLGGMDGEYSRRIPVDCKLNMQGKLLSPRIKYSIDLPTASEETKSKLRAALSNEDELDKQFVTLLIGRTFYSGGGNTGTGSNNVGSSASRSLPSEFLSNQISNLLSQATDKVDIGVNYSPGDEAASQQFEVALSTHLFNDRVTISTNVGTAGSQTTTTTTTTNKSANDIVGDFNLDYKVTESGKLHLKAFNRSNDQMLNEQAPYTQGVGIFYRGEFNTFGELFRRKKKVQPTEDTVPNLPNKKDEPKKDSINNTIILPKKEENKTTPQP
jgi:hypothetical protein